LVYHTTYCNDDVKKKISEYMKLNEVHSLYGLMVEMVTKVFYIMLIHALAAFMCFQI
jgi:hypothetical protein